VGSDHLVNGAVTGAKLANLSVGSGHLVDGTVTGAKLANLSVGSGHLVDGTVTGAKLANLSVGGDHLVNGAVTGAKLANLSVGSGHLTVGAVTGATLANGSILFEHFNIDVELSGSLVLMPGGKEVISYTETDPGWQNRPSFWWVSLVPTTENADVEWFGQVTCKRVMSTLGYTYNVWLKSGSAVSTTVKYLIVRVSTLIGAVRIVKFPLGGDEPRRPTS